MIHTKEVFNSFGNLMANSTAMVLLNGEETSFSPLVSNEFGLVTFEGEDENYVIKLVENV